MANRLVTNPIYFDIFNVDAVFAKKDQTLTVRKIRWKSVDDGDLLQLADSDGNTIFEDINTSATDWRDIDFGEDGFPFADGVRIIVANCTGMGATDGSDALYIYTK